MARKQAEAWWAASRKLGFELKDDSNGNALTPQWDAMASSLRPHTQLSEHNWMVGSVDGVPLLITYYFRDGGSGSDTLYTHVIAQIDPPLFLGLHLARRTWLCGASRIDWPFFDDKLYVQALQPERGRALVWPGRHPPLTDVLFEAMANGFGPEVYDSVAVITVSRFEANPAVLDDMCRRALGLARVAKARRAMLGETAEEAASRVAWGRFAEHEHMAFDSERRSLTGVYQGIHAEVVTRSTPSSMWNQVSVLLPSDTGMRVSITPESSLSRLGNVIGFSDIEVGDPTFDRELRLKGEPAPRVRAFFASPEVRALTLKLVERHGHLGITGRFISVQLPRYARAPETLESTLMALAALVVATQQALPQQGPYRS